MVSRPLVCLASWSTSTTPAWMARWVRTYGVARGQCLTSSPPTGTESMRILASRRWVSTVGRSLRLRAQVLTQRLMEQPPRNSIPRPRSGATGPPPSSPVVHGLRAAVFCDAAARVRKTFAEQVDGRTDRYCRLTFAVRAITACDRPGAGRSGAAPRMDASCDLSLPWKGGVQACPVAVDSG